METVPQILHPDGADDPRRATTQFLDLLLSDQELLRTEFDAIIAADWASPPAGPKSGRGHARFAPDGVLREQER